MSAMVGLEYVGYIDPWTDEERLSDEEVVRCRDCERQWALDLSNTYGTHEHDQMYCALTVGHSRLVMPDGFCAWAERRDA